MADAGSMGALSLGDGGRCLSCRGRGWRYVWSREGLADRMVDDDAERAPRSRCSECSGSGRAGTSGAAVLGPANPGGVEVGAGPGPGVGEGGAEAVVVDAGAGEVLDGEAEWFAGGCR